MLRGRLICFEGLDRAGKGTQAVRLWRSLGGEGGQARLLRFPNRDSETGQIIDKYLKKEGRADAHVLHLLFSANRWE